MCVKHGLKYRPRPPQNQSAVSIIAYQKYFNCQIQLVLYNVFKILITGHLFQMTQYAADLHILSFGHYINMSNNITNM